MSSPTKISSRPLHNRILPVLSHIPRYAFQGEKRLALDSGVSASALCRVVTGQSSPSFALVDAIAKTLSTRLGKHIDPSELVSIDGTYPTPSVCRLVGCNGCLPERAFDADCKLCPAFEKVQPGTWSGNVPPKRSVTPVTNTSASTNTTATAEVQL